ncbi:MAG: sigma 54-interacting transcriptional regulator [Planctomycetota bacterium]|jgi:DNA-binding NtrC family response regulator
MAVLRVTKGRSTSDQFELKSRVVVGRATDADIRLFDDAASRQHAVVSREGESYVVKDLGSTNGTFVNGRRVERHVLKSGDELAIRDLRLIFMDDGDAERATVIEDQKVSIISRIEPKRARVSGGEDVLLGRLAAVYRFTSVLSGPTRRLKKSIVKALEETFAPCRAALVLPGGDIGTFDRSVVDHVRRKGEAVASQDQAMAAPLGRYGALYVEGRAFREDDLELLTALANAATPVLQPPAVRPAGGGDAPAMIGDSPVMRKLREEIARVAPAETTVLVTGETGSGKELVARALHAQSLRGTRPCVAVNCAAFVETLLEAELFGHEKGAFTGADRAHPGCFEQAHTGTLFLDEVGELAPGLQAKLLRVLETKEFRRLGATKTTRVDVRVVAATNRDLKGSADFREDLYYRLGVITIECPPLRARGGDIDLLAAAFLPDGKSFSEGALETLRGYAWPGNVRELKNICDRCAVLAEGDVIEADMLPLELRLGGQPALETGEVKTLKEMEREMVIRALEATGGNRTKAAKLLGITYPTLKKKIDEQQRGPPAAD